MVNTLVASREKLDLFV